MTPSERIKQIKDISKALSKEEKSIIDLTLEQHNLPTDYWDEYEAIPYVIAMLRKASDESLLDLSEHLGTASELKSIIVPSSGQPNQPLVFISHLSKIKDKTILIKEELEKYSISAFVAHSDIEPTKEWQTEIENALLTMDALVALLSPGFKESSWTDQEVGVAIGRKVPIISVRMGLDPHGFIGKFQGLQDNNKNERTIAREIVEILMTKPNIAPKIAPGLVEIFFISSSFEDAKQNMSMLEHCNHLTPDMVPKLKKTIINSQVSDAFGVPERVKNLIKKIGV